MEGKVYIEQDLNCYPCDIWVEKYLQSFPFLGLKWFDCTHPLISSSNLIEKLQARDEHCDWISGGNINLCSLKSSISYKPSCRVKSGNDSNDKLNLLFDQKSLYTFQIEIKPVDQNNMDMKLMITIGCDDQNNRDKWMKEIREIETRQQYLMACKMNSIRPSITIYDDVKDYQNEMNLEDIQISEEMLESIKTYLNMRAPHGIMLQTLMLDNIQLKDTHIPILNEFIQIMPALAYLSLKDNYITSVGMYYLCETLVKVKELTSLNLSGNNLNDEYMDHIMYYLSKCKYLRNFDISHNFLTNASVRPITLYLTTHSCKLVSLNLSYNNLGDGAAAIASILMRIEPSIIQSIDISFCNIKTVGLTELSLALEYAKSLRWLNIRGCQINIQSEIEFMKAISNHRQLYYESKYPFHRNGPPIIETIQVLMGGVALGSDTITRQSSELKSLKFSLPYIDSKTLMKSIIVQRRWINPIYKPIEELVGIDSGDVRNSFNSISTKRPFDAIQDNDIHDDNLSVDSKDLVSSALPFLQSNGGGTYQEYLQSASVLVDRFYQPPLSLPSSSLFQSSSPLNSPRSNKLMNSTNSINGVSSMLQDESKRNFYNTIEKFVYMKVKFPKFIQSEHEFLVFLSEAIGCDRRQLLLMSTYQNASMLPTFMKQSEYDTIEHTSTCIAFSIEDLNESDIDTLHHRIVSRSVTSQLSTKDLKEILIHEDYHESPRYFISSDTILHNLKALCTTSDASLRMLGVQTAYLQFPVSTNSSSLPDSKPEKYQVVHCHIASSSHSGLDMKYEYFPLSTPNLNYLNKYVTSNFDLDTDDEIDEKDTGIDDINGSMNEKKENQPVTTRILSWSNLGQIAKENRENRLLRARERQKRRLINEQLIHAIRQLYKDNEISSSIAKFWEGALGNMKSYRDRCFRGIIEAINEDGIFIAVARRKELLDVMFRRDLNEIFNQIHFLKSIHVSNHAFDHVSTGHLSITMESSHSNRISADIIDSKSQGLIILLGERLLQELKSLQSEAKLLSAIATHPSHLSLIEDFLLLCGKLGYTGPETIDAISRRQSLLSKGLKEYPVEFQNRLNITKQKALLSNLMISRDMNGLKGSLDNIMIDPSHYEIYRNLPEFLIAKDMLSDYASCLSNLRITIQNKDIFAIEDCLASMAYGNYYTKDIISRGIDILLELSRNPKKKLLLPVLTGLRTLDNKVVIEGIERCERAGWNHFAIKLPVVLKIIEARKRLQDDESFRADIVKIALAIKNDINTPTGHIANIWRRIKSSSVVYKDEILKPYINVIEKRMKKLTGFVKLDADVQGYIDTNDIDSLSNLIKGFGSSRIVLGMTSESVMNEWIEKISDCINGIIARGGRKIDESDPTFDDMIIITGTFDKLARSDKTKNKSWKTRYFVLKGKFLCYYTSQDGQLKGQVRVRNGSVRIMNTREVDGRSYCIEILEGIDILSLDPILLSEAKRMVAVGRKKLIEDMIKVGMKSQSVSAIENAFQEANILGVSIDEKLLREAKTCIHSLQTIDMKRSLYLASIDIPISQFYELLSKAKELQLDPNNSLLQTVYRISEMSELQQLILRLRGTMIYGNDYLFRKTFHQITRYERKQFTSSDRNVFIGILMQYISYQSYRSYLDADSYRSIIKHLRHSIACCLSFHIETEAIQLANLIAKQQTRSAVASGMVPPPPPTRKPSQKAIFSNSSSGNGSPSSPSSPSSVRGSRTDSTNVQASTTTILQFFDDQRNHLSNHLHPQYSIEKYPYLRVKSTKKGSGLINLFFSSKKKNKNPSSSASANTLLAAMMFTDSKIKKSLLDEEIIPSLNQQVCIKCFEKIQIVMGDRSIDSYKQSYSNERLTSIPNVIADLVKIGNQDIQYADEMYLQLCKQLTGNTSIRSRLQGWSLFSIFLHSFGMSFELIPYIKNFISYAAGAEAAKLSFASNSNKSNSKSSGKLNTTEEKKKTNMMTSNSPRSRSNSPRSRSNSPRSRSNSPDNSGKILTVQDAMDFYENNAELSPSPENEDILIEADSIDFIVQLASYCTKLISKIEQGFISKPILSTDPIILNNNNNIMVGSKSRRGSSVMISTMKFSIPSTSLITRVLNRQTIKFEILIMTGSLYQFEVKYGEVDTPLTLLSLLYNRIVGGGRILKALSEYYGLRKNISKSPNVWTDFLLKQFRGMMFYLDEGSDIHNFGIHGGGKTISQTLDDIPVQVEDIHRLDWDHDFLWDLLLASGPPILSSPFMDETMSMSTSVSTPVPMASPTASEIRLRRVSQIMTQGSVPRLILRKSFSSSSETFANQFELFDDQVSERDMIASRNLWIYWLKSSIHSIKPLPADFLRIDLLFAEESRVVNNRLYPMSMNSLSYLAALQISIHWEDEDNPIFFPNQWESDNCNYVMTPSHAGDLSIRPCYRFMPNTNMYRSNSTNFYLGRESITVNRRNSISGNPKSNRRQSKSDLSQSIAIPQGNQRISRFFRRSIVGGSDIDKVTKAIRRQSLRKDSDKTSSSQQNSFKTESLDKKSSPSSSRKITNGNDNQNDNDNDIEDIIGDGNSDDYEDNDYYYYGDSSEEDEEKDGDNRFSSSMKKVSSKYRRTDTLNRGRKGSMNSDSDTSSASYDSSEKESDDLDKDSDISDDDDDERKQAAKRKVGSLLLVANDLSPKQLQAIRKRLVTMGLIGPISADQGTIAKEEQTLIDKVIFYLTEIHNMLKSNNIPNEVTSTPRFRYFIKRGYIQYLMTNPFYGNHFTSAKLQPMTYSSSSSSSSPLFPSFKKEVDVVIAVSPQGLYFLDSNYWQVTFFTPLWDIEDIEIIRSGQSILPTTFIPNSNTEESVVPVIITKPSLKICVNGMNLVLSSDMQIVQEQYRILHGSIFEAVGRGIFPHGVESTLSITKSIGGANHNTNDSSSVTYENTKEAIKRFFHDYHLLPPAPAMHTLVRSKAYFEAPRSRREELAEERALEEAKELEQSRLAAQLSMEKLQEEMEKGRNTVMSRYRVGSMDDGEDIEIEVDRQTTEPDSPTSAAAANRKSSNTKLLKRQPSTEDVRDRSSVTMIDELMKRRIDAGVTGVPFHQTKSSKRLYTVPSPPRKKGAALRFVDLPEGIKSQEVIPVYQTIFDELKANLSKDVLLAWNKLENNEINSKVVESVISTTKETKVSSKEKIISSNKNDETTESMFIPITWSDQVLKYNDRLNFRMDKELGSQQITFNQPMNVSNNSRNQVYGGNLHDDDYHNKVDKSRGIYYSAGGILKGKSVNLMKRLKREKGESP